MVGGAGARFVKRALLRLLNTGVWADGVKNWTCLSAPTTSSKDLRVPVDAIVAIPACNESLRIERCLDACLHSAIRSGANVRLVILVNGTSDDTASRALSWSRRRCCPITLVDVDFVPALAHAGAARRLALDVACLHARTNTALLTTDADAQPTPSWIAANLAQLHQGAHLVCGHVALDPVESAQLLAQVEAVGRIEARYGLAARELTHLLDPDPCNPWPHHGQTAGASLAIRAGDLATVGGIPLVACGEDRALAHRVRASGLNVVHAHDVEIEVSCRLRGRAAGGMADALRERTRHPDPVCDESLEPAAALRTRIAGRAWLRLRWARTGERHAALIRLGSDGELASRLARVSQFEEVWYRFEEAIYHPGRVRLRASDLHRELPALMSLLDAARNHRPGVDDPFTIVDRHADMPDVCGGIPPGAMHPAVFTDRENA